MIVMNEGDKNMKKLLLIVGLLIVALIAIWILLLSRGEDTSNQTTDQTATINQAEQGSPEFNITSTESVSFIAKMEGKTSEDESYEGQIEYDGEGNFFYSGSSGEEVFEFYSYEGRSIFCSNDSCFEGPSTTATLPFSQDQIDIDEDDVDDYRENASYIGSQACNSGTCDGWEIATGEYKGTLLINDSGRVDRANWQGPEGSFTINYSYEPVDFTLPENIQSIPAV